jgi:ArsR family transcriptional regulator, arsenate/arsenite/antimonite-responsive transcriptional repressor
MEREAAVQELLANFKAVADPTRLRILRMLKEKPLCVCEVMAVLGMAQSTTSRHLQVLQGAGLIEAVPGGIWTVYRIPEHASPPVASLLALVKACEPTSQMKRDAEEARRVDRSRLCKQARMRPRSKGR